MAARSIKKQTQSDHRENGAEEGITKRNHGRNEEQHGASAWSCVNADGRDKPPRADNDECRRDRLRANAHSLYKVAPRTYASSKIAAPCEFMDSIEGHEAALDNGEN